MFLNYWNICQRGRGWRKKTHFLFSKFAAGGFDRFMRSVGADPLADHRPFFRFLRRQLAAELWQTCRRNFWNFQGTMIAWRHILGVFLADFQNNIILLTAVARYKFPQELTFCLQGIVWVNKHVIAAKLLVLAALALCSTGKVVWNLWKIFCRSFQPTKGCPDHLAHLSSWENARPKDLKFNSDSK